MLLIPTRKVVDISGDSSVPHFASFDNGLSHLILVATKNKFLLLWNPFVFLCILRIKVLLLYDGKSPSKLWDSLRSMATWPKLCFAGRYDFRRHSVKGLSCVSLLCLRFHKRAYQLLGRAWCRFLLARCHLDCVMGWQPTRYWLSISSSIDRIRLYNALRLVLNSKKRIKHFMNVCL